MKWWQRLFHVCIRQYERVWIEEETEGYICIEPCTISRCRICGEVRLWTTTGNGTWYPDDYEAWKSTLNIVDEPSDLAYRQERIA